jgi:bifunctional DNA-binding transcriptional regulator/antitoxin component of YhaV-PrlF toxin-antitoxin module
MRNIITVTSKGQTTLPVAMRRRLGIPKEGGVLQVSFDEQSGKLVISAPTSPEDLAKRLSAYIKPGVEPITNVSDYYTNSADRRNK